MLDLYAFYGSSPLDTCARSYCFDSGLGFLCLDLLAGGSPAASNFLLVRQKKVSRRRATPGQQSPAQLTTNKNTTEPMAGTKP